MKTKKSGFTLAEVLVSLMIIGVIAGVTIPGLISSSEQKENIAGCKKAYSTLANAVNLAEQANGPVKRWGLKDSTTATDFDTFLAPYLNISKKCSNSTGCFGEGTFKKYSGQTYSDLTTTGYGSPRYAFKLADGMNVAYDVYPASYIYPASFGAKVNLTTFFYFFVDVNGDKAPNTLGKDIFIFVETSDGLKPAGADNNSADCGNGSAGTECAAMVIKYSDMNYDKHR